MMYREKMSKESRSQGSKVVREAIIIGSSNRILLNFISS